MVPWCIASHRNTTRFSFCFQIEFLSFRYCIFALDPGNAIDETRSGFSAMGVDFLEAFFSFQF